MINLIYDKDLGTKCFMGVKCDLYNVAPAFPSDIAAVVFNYDWHALQMYGGYFLLIHATEISAKIYPQQCDCFYFSKMQSHKGTHEVPCLRQYF